MRLGSLLRMSFRDAMPAQVALHRVQLKDEELQTKKREQHLDFLVGQTEKFSKMIAADMQGVTPTLTNAVANAASSAPNAEAVDDRCL